MSPKIVLALAAVAAAQTTTLEIFAPMLEGGLDATVISVDGSTTTLGLACPKGSSSDECGLSGPDLFTHIGAPSTMSYHYENEQDELFMDGHCELGSVADCTGSVSVNGEEMASDVETIEDWKTWVNTVTVTAGAEKLTASGDGPTQTSGDGPSETGSEEGEDEDEGEDGDEGESEGDDDDDSGAVQLACAPLLGAAAIAVGAVLI